MRELLVTSIMITCSAQLVVKCFDCNKASAGTVLRGQSCLPTWRSRSPNSSKQLRMGDVQRHAHIAESQAAGGQADHASLSYNQARHMLQPSRCARAPHRPGRPQPCRRQRRIICNRPKRRTQYIAENLAQAAKVLPCQSSAS